MRSNLYNISASVAAIFVVSVLIFSLGLHSIQTTHQHHEHGGSSETQPPKKERDMWFQKAITQYSKNLDVKAFVYNLKTNSVYLCTTYEPSDIINANTYHEKERSIKKNGERSTRYEWHQIVVFDYSKDSCL